MKRDLDFIREILLYIEKNDDGSGVENWQGLSIKDLNIVNGHLKLLSDPAFIVVEVVSGEGLHNHFIVERMTMSGHDYLDSVRDPKVWGETKDRLAEIGGGTALAIVQAVAIDVIKVNLGLI